MRLSHSARRNNTVWPDFTMKIVAVPWAQYICSVSWEQLRRGAFRTTRSTNLSHRLSARLSAALLARIYTQLQTKRGFHQRLYIVSKEFGHICAEWPYHRTSFAALEWSSNGINSFCIFEFNFSHIRGYSCKTQSCTL